jgi:hypothetical protein
MRLQEKSESCSPNGRKNRAKLQKRKTTRWTKSEQQLEALKKRVAALEKGTKDDWSSQTARVTAPFEVVSVPAQ